MHFAVFWQILRPEQGPAIQGEISAILAPLPKLPPLPSTSYVVKVNSAEEYSKVTAALIAVSNSHKDGLYMLITPMITGGRYSGFLPNTYWAELNKLSE